MKKIIFIACLFFIGIYCYGQNIEVMTVEYNGRWDDFMGMAGKWPTQQAAPQVRSQWQSVLSKFNLERMNSGNDPFSRNNEGQLEERLKNIAMESIGTRGNSLSLDGFTVYLTMGTRRFVCFVQVTAGARSYYIWTYEVKQ